MAMAMGCCSSYTPWHAACPRARPRPATPQPTAHGPRPTSSLGHSDDGPPELRRTVVAALGSSTQSGPATQQSKPCELSHSRAMLHCQKASRSLRVAVMHRTTRVVRSRVNGRNTTWAPPPQQGHHRPHAMAKSHHQPFRRRGSAAANQRRPSTSQAGTLAVPHRHLVHPHTTPPSYHNNTTSSCIPSAPPAHMANHL
ncbi:hypothetical protein T440DRAFT_547715 [Plenodomus tracheiphilus IPT5]|uniref:Uncharacterized protein n=1 Tax=Plenodomus tracheiphilus IPT5 TaxID=1408161 RepID=A0A6A7BDC3_9PLEO|nr:hypothetical protein T440DRAFT_547715 [Plenodomus tracheiphilus IPT5]